MAAVLGRIATVNDTLGRPYPHQYHAGHLPRGTSYLHDAEDNIGQSGAVITGMERTGYCRFEVFLQCSLDEIGFVCPLQV